MRDALVAILIIVIVVVVIGAIIIILTSLPPDQMAKLDQTVANIINQTG